MITRESQLLVESTAAAFARGELVVVADDDDRENEGDLFVAAAMCTPEKMAFIIRHTSGIVCAPLSVEEAKRLHLDPMVAIPRPAWICAGSPGCRRSASSPSS